MHTVFCCCCFVLFAGSFLGGIFCCELNFTEVQILIQTIQSIKSQRGVQPNHFFLGPVVSPEKKKEIVFENDIFLYFLFFKKNLSCEKHT